MIRILFLVFASILFMPDSFAAKQREINVSINRVKKPAPKNIRANIRGGIIARLSMVRMRILNKKSDLWRVQNSKARFADAQKVVIQSDLRRLQNEERELTRQLSTVTF